MYDNQPTNDRQRGYRRPAPPPSSFLNSRSVHQEHTWPVSPIVRSTTLPLWWFYWAPFKQITHGQTSVLAFYKKNKTYCSLSYICSQALLYGLMGTADMTNHKRAQKKKTGPFQDTKALILVETKCVCPAAQVTRPISPATTTCFLTGCL